jgi:hypothetical protein
MTRDPADGVTEESLGMPCDQKAWPIINGKDHDAPSMFRPEALLREARRQKQLPVRRVPDVCVLDPDGDIVRNLKRAGSAKLFEGWACYHTELFTVDLDGVGTVGIIG